MKRKKNHFRFIFGHVFFKYKLFFLNYSRRIVEKQLHDAIIIFSLNSIFLSTFIHVHVRFYHSFIESLIICLLHFSQKKNILNIQIFSSSVYVQTKHILQINLYNCVWTFPFLFVNITIAAEMDSCVHFFFCFVSKLEFWLLLWFFTVLKLLR